MRLITEQGYKQTEAASNLGIDRGMLARWVKGFQTDEGEAFRGNGKLAAEGEELGRLREENRRLKMERDPDPKHEKQQRCIKDLAEASDHIYGSRRMAKALQALGYRVGRYEARNLMREAGVWVRYRRRYRATTNSRRLHSYPGY